ncbi:MAG: Gfo/Idh/MocA family oxidoreductase [Candidatus Aenigmarchaeota archaeon]|nr:Gfo/Idh/MocA family oxidoreductase [Candidatus Aenigmarchaeota archaeon]
MVNIAVVGIGRWGKNLVRELNALCTVTTCCSNGSAANVEWLKENYPSIKHTFSYDDVLKDRSIDAVVIATPIETHAALARRALEAGKHVFVEKPLATSYEEADALNALARKRGRTLFVGHVFLHHPAWKQLKIIVQKEGVRQANMEWLKWGTFGEELVWNLLVHDVALAIDLFGDVKKVEVKYTQQWVTSTDVLAVTLHFPGDRRCAIHVNRVSSAKKKVMTVKTGENAYLWEDDKLFKAIGESLSEVYRAEESALTAECKDFLKVIEMDESSETDGAFGAEVVKTAEKIRNEIKDLVQ